jgi:hypothetical protein
MTAAISVVRLGTRSRRFSVRGWSLANVANLLTTPFIYSLAVPFVLLDIWVTAYQWACFPVYGIPRVPRRPYFVVDRHRLPYLTAYEKANCLYCGYANGLIGYVREVTARTEQFWCPIKHQRRRRDAHRRYRGFAAYGDAAAYRRQLPQFRRTLRRRHGGTHVAR